MVPRCVICTFCAGTATLIFGRQPHTGNEEFRVPLGAMVMYDPAQAACHVARVGWVLLGRSALSKMADVNGWRQQFWIASDPRGGINGALFRFTRHLAANSLKRMLLDRRNYVKLVWSQRDCQVETMWKGRIAGCWLRSSQKG